MKLFRLFHALTLTALLGSVAHAAESDRRLLLKEGSIHLNAAGARLSVSAARKGDESQPSVTVTWKTGDATESSSTPMRQEGWFAFAEQLNRVWVFDGESLSLLERAEKSLGSKAVTARSKEFKNAPREVREALPKDFLKKK